jgi:hypothetical protein
MSEEGQDGAGDHADIKVEETVPSDCPELPPEMPVINNQPLERQVRIVDRKCWVLAK